MAKKYVSVEGVATLVHHRGATTLPGQPPDLSQGPAILFLHGAGGNGNEFADILDALEGGFTPIAYDQPGHGRSGELDSLGSVEAMAAHAMGLAAALGLSGSTLVGDGLGASVALEIALTDPGTASALVLVGGATARSGVTDEEINALRRIVEGKDRRNFDTTGYAPTTPREVYQRAFGEWVKTDPRATLGDRRAEQAWDGRDRLASVAVPVLVVVGEAEDDAGRKGAEAIVAALPDARLAEVPGAGRRVVYEQPRELATLIADFVREVSR